jgi:ABC-type nitrate/sulfonate/bicarbonate transport system permease component
VRPRTTNWKGGIATALGAAGIVVVLLAWELASQAGLLDKASFPPPSDVLPELLRQLGSGAFWSAVGDTMTSAAIGLLITVVIGLPLGIAIGLNRSAYLSSRVLVEMLKPIPPVALLPLGLIIYGTTLKMKLLLVVFGTLWPLLIQVVDGVRDVDPVQVDTARSYRFGRRRMVWDVVLPTALPYVATGLRLAAVAAFVLSIVTELVGGAAGLGLSMQYAQNGADYTTLYAFILASGLLGLAINQAFALLERPLLHWHPSQRGEVAG